MIVDVILVIVKNFFNKKCYSWGNKKPPKLFGGNTSKNVWLTILKGYF